KHGRTYNPAQQSSRNILKRKKRIAKEIQSGLEYSDSLVRTCRDSRLPLLLLCKRCGRSLRCEGFGFVTDAVAFDANTHRDHEVVENDVITRRGEQFRTNGKQFTRSADNCVKLRILTLHE